MATLCAFGLLTYAAMLAAQYFLLKTTDRKEITIDTIAEKTTKARSWNANLATMTAVGAEVVSGLALLG